VTTTMTAPVWLEEVAVMLSIVGAAVWFVWKVENMLHEEATLGSAKGAQGIVSPLFMTSRAFHRGTPATTATPTRSGATASLLQRTPRSLRHRSDPLPGVRQGSAPLPARRQRSDVMPLRSDLEVRSHRRSSDLMPGNFHESTAQPARQNQSTTKPLPKSSPTSATKPLRKSSSSTHTPKRQAQDIPRAKEASGIKQEPRPRRVWEQASGVLHEGARLVEEYARQTNLLQKDAREAELQEKARRAEISEMEELARLQVSNSFHVLINSQSFSELADKTCEQLHLSRYDLWRKKALWNSLKATWASMAKTTKLPEIASRPSARMPSPPSTVVVDSPVVEDCDPPFISSSKHGEIVAMHDDDTHKEPASVNKTQGARAEQDLRALMTQHLLARMQRKGDALVIVTNGGGLRVL